MVDETRFRGDDTIGGYSGPYKELLICLQLELKISILVEDAFPKSIDFERTIKAIFEAKTREAFERNCENKPLLDFPMRVYANVT